MSIAQSARSIVNNWFPARVRNTVLARSFLAAKKPDLRPSYYRATERYLERYLPLLPDYPSSVTRRDIVALIDRIEGDSGRVSADRAKGALSSYFSWCLDRGYLEHSPCIGLKSRAGSRARDRVLEPHELAALWHGVKGMENYERLVRLLILTGCRRQELGSLAWTEVQLQHPQGPLLSISAGRAKGKRQRVVPLVAEAIALLPPALGDGYHPTYRRLVFPGGPRGFYGWGWGKRALDKGLIGFREWQLRDIRRTVATGLGDLGVSDDIIGRVLGHAPSGVTRVHYALSEKLPEQRQALELWSQHVARIVGSGAVVHSNGGRLAESGG